MAVFRVIVLIGESSRLPMELGLPSLTETERCFQKQSMERSTIVNYPPLKPCRVLKWGLAEDPVLLYFL